MLFIWTQDGSEQTIVSGDLMGGFPVTKICTQLRTKGHRISLWLHIFQPMQIRSSKKTVIYAAHLNQIQATVNSVFSEPVHRFTFQAVEGINLSKSPVN